MIRIYNVSIPNNNICVFGMKLIGNSLINILFLISFVFCSCVRIRSDETESNEDKLFGFIFCSHNHIYIFVHYNINTFGQKVP